MFYEALNIYFPAFQSAVSIKDGCSSYVFPIHQRPRDARLRTDGQLDMMEGERVGIRQGSEGKGKILRNENEKNGSPKRNAAEITVKAREWRRKNVRYKLNSVASMFGAKS